MQVKALVSFKGRVGASSWHVVQGEEMELPEGVDWLQVGLVEAVAPAKEPAPHLASVERATDKRVERAEVRGEQHGLMDISGIGRKLADNLKAHGVSTPAELLAADPEALAQAVGVSAAAVRTWQTNAGLL